MVHLPFLQFVRLNWFTLIINFLSSGLVLFLPLYFLFFFTFHHYIHVALRELWFNNIRCTFYSWNLKTQTPKMSNSSSLIWIKHNGSTEVHIYYSQPSALRWIIDMIQCLILCNIINLNKPCNKPIKFGCNAYLLVYLVQYYKILPFVSHMYKCEKVIIFHQWIP